MKRAMYYSSVLGIDLGMYYKRRNYSIIVDGKNPIEAHEYLGRDVRGMDVMIIDDMISSGESVLDIAQWHLHAVGPVQHNRTDSTFQQSVVF